MVTQEQKKEFALSQLAPYLADPSTCGFNVENKTCNYITPDGRMCVAGKNMIEPKLGLIKGIDDILRDLDHIQEGLFKPEVVGILTTTEWNNMQHIHDTIALDTKNVDKLINKINQLNLFTYEELVERANSLKKLEN